MIYTIWFMWLILALYSSLNLGTCMVEELSRIAVILSNMNHKYILGEHEWLKNGGAECRISVILLIKFTNAYWRDQRTDDVFPHRSMGLAPKQYELVLRARHVPCKPIWYHPTYWMVYVKLAFIALNRLIRTEAIWANIGGEWLNYMSRVLLLLRCFVPIYVLILLVWDITIIIYIRAL